MARIPKFLHLSASSRKTCIHHMSNDLFPQSIIVWACINKLRHFITSRQFLLWWTWLVEVKPFSQDKFQHTLVYIEMSPCVEVYMASVSPGIPLIWGVKVLYCTLSPVSEALCMDIRSCNVVIQFAEDDIIMGRYKDWTGLYTGIDYWTGIFWF